MSTIMRESVYHLDTVTQAIWKIILRTVKGVHVEFSAFFVREKGDLGGRAELIAERFGFTDGIVF